MYTVKPAPDAGVGLVKSGGTAGRTCTSEHAVAPLTGTGPDVWSVVSTGYAQILCVPTSQAQGVHDSKRSSRF